MNARMRVSALVTAALLVAGCGDHDLVLNVDLLSFTRELQDPFVFPPVPPTPGGLATGEQALVDDQTVNLVEGLGDAVAIREVTIRLRSIATATSGTGTDTLRIYLSDANTAPRTTAAAIVQVLTFNAGVADTATTVLSGDPRVDGLFKGNTVRISVTTSFRGPSAGFPLAGSLAIDALDATVIAGRR